MSTFLGIAIAPKKASSHLDFLLCDVYLRRVVKRKSVRTCKMKKKKKEQEKNILKSTNGYLNEAREPKALPSRNKRRVKGSRLICYHQGQHAGKERADGGGGVRRKKKKRTWKKRRKMKRRG